MAEIRFAYVNRVHHVSFQLLLNYKMGTSHPFTT